MLPSGATVTQGTATVSQTGSNSLLIDQTSGSAIINWDSFSIGAGGITHFNNGTGATLNRVTGNLPSQIDGSLTATGSLYLINPAGMVVGTGGMVATGGTFAASTHDVSDADFLDGGDTVFSGNSKAGIINHGTISSAMGDVALIARRVENAGDISAPNGTAALLAGYDILMHETAGPNGKFVVRAGGSDTEVVNSGTINAAEVELRANGGNVLALAGNTKGVVKATGVSKRGGRIFLTAGGGKVQVGGRVTARRRTSSGSAQQSGGDVFINADTVLASGHIDVSGLGAAGGNIDIGGRDIALQGTTLDASGTSGGGQVRVGGAYQGGDFGGLNVADTLLIDGLSVLRADGTDANADGGTVIAWSDDHTVFEGFISARGSGSGDGGFAEVSGKQTLSYSGLADLRSDTGTTGMLLLDPMDFVVDAAGDVTGTDLGNQLDISNVTLFSSLGSSSGNGDVIFNESVSWASGNRLSVNADNDIQVNAAITSTGGGDIDFNADNGLTIDAAIDTNGGDVGIRTDALALNSTLDAGTGNVTLLTTSSGQDIWFGSNDFAGTLGLTSAEMNRVTAASFLIGGSANGDVLMPSNFGFNTATNVSVATPGNLNIFGNFSNAGTGDISLIAGWDGATTDPAAFLSSDLATQTTFGNNNAIVNIFASTSSITVGSANGDTNVFSGRLDLKGGTAGDSFALLGNSADYGSPGDVLARLTGNLLLDAGSGDGAFAVLGGVKLVDPESLSGDISVEALGSVSLNGGGGNTAYAQIGYSAANTAGGSVGGTNGDITVSALGNISLTAGDEDNSYVQIGHGGRSGSDDFFGDILVEGNIVNLTGGTTLGSHNAYAQIGHGEASVGQTGQGDGLREGTITVRADGSLIANDSLPSYFNFTRIGHATATDDGVRTAAGVSDIGIFAEDVILTGDIDAADGALTIGRNTAGSIGIGDGVTSTFMKLSNAELANLTAGSTTFGDSTNTNSIIVDGGDYSAFSLGDVTLATTTTGVVQLNDGTANYIFDALTVSTGTATIAADISTAGGQTYNANLNLANPADGSVLFESTGGGALTFNGTLNGLADLIVNTSGATTFNANIGNSTPINSLTTGGGGTTFLDAGAGTGFIAASGNSLTFNDAVVLLSTHTITDTGDITFASTLDSSSTGTYGLTVKTPGTVTFTGQVGATDPLYYLLVNRNIGGPTLGPINLGAGVTTTGSQHYGTAVTLTGHQLLRATDPADAALVPDIWFHGTVNSVANNPKLLSLDTRGTIWITHSVGAGANGVLSGLAVNTSYGEVRIGTSGDAADAVSINVYGNGATTGRVQFWNPVTLNSSLTINRDGAASGMGTYVQMTGGVESEVGEYNSLTINSNGRTQLGGGFGGASSGGAELGGLTTDARGTTDISGTFRVNGNTTTFNNFVVLQGDTEINDTGDVVFAKTVDSQSVVTPNVLEIDAGGDVTFGDLVGGTVELASLQVAANQINLSDGVTTAGSQVYDGPVVLTGDSAFVTTGGNPLASGTFADTSIGFFDTVNGAHDMSVTTDGGAISFGGNIGNSSPLASLTTSGASSTRIGGTIELDGNTLTFNTPVLLTADTIITDTGDVTFASTVNSETTARFLVVNTPGITTFGGRVGNLLALSTLTTDAPGSTLLSTTDAGSGSTPAIRTTGAILFNDDVVISSAKYLRSTTSLTFGGKLDAAAAGDQVGFVGPGSLTFNGAVGSNATVLRSLIVSSLSSVTVNGGSIRTSNSQYYAAPIILGADTEISSISSDVTFNSTVTGPHALTVSAGGTIKVEGGLVATGGTQTYNDRVSVAGTVFAATGVGADLDFVGGVTTTLPNNDVWFLAADDIFFRDDAQWGGSGNMTIVAGWNAADDGTTGWSAGGTTADTSVLDNTGNYGLGTGDIFIGDGNQAAGISVGSRDGTTTALARNVSLTGGGLGTFSIYSQLGFRGAATGDINVMATGGLSALSGAGVQAYTQVGHGGINLDQSFSGDITVDVAGDLTFSGGGGTSASQLGHGGNAADGNHSGAITIEVGGNASFTGGDGSGSYAQLGHGGLASVGNHSGAIAANISGNFSLTGGGDAAAFAQFGHGAADFSSSGTRMGNISAVVGGQTFFDAGAGGYWFGHASTGTVSNANVALVTNGLSFAGLSPATGPTAASGDFADMVRYNLIGGNVLVANRLAQIGDADSGTPDYTDDIIFFGQGNDDSFDTDHSLTFAATGEVSFEEGLQIEGSGNINLAAGWDGTTGLDLTGFPMLSMTDIETAGAFGASSGAAGDNGDVNIREFNPGGSIYVGTWLGDIHVLAHDLEVLGGPADGSSSRLGAWPQAFVDVDSNIRIVVKDDVVVTGGDGNDAFAIIGHGFGDGQGNIDGDITIVADTAGNYNEVVVIGGDGDLAFGQIGHNGDSGAINGGISIQSDDVFVGFDNFRSSDGFADGLASFSRIGHQNLGHPAGSTGKIEITAKGDIVVVGGDGGGTLAAIGHLGTAASGDIALTTGNDMYVDGGDDLLSFAQVGHFVATTGSGKIDVDVGDDLFVRGSFDKDLAPALIGHFGLGDLSGDIDLDIAENFDLLGGQGNFSFGQIGHGSEQFPGARQGNITLIAGEEATIEDGTGTGSLAWIGHGTTTAGGTTNANVFLQAFGFDRDSGSTVAAGGLGSFNKDILEADIVGGNFTLIATGTGLLVEDPVYNSPFQLLMAVNNDMVLDTNATFVNSGTGDIILAAGGDFHNDTGSLTPITTGGRWLVYSTRPDNNRNDIEITNWDFLRYGTNFDINNPLVGSGDGLIYSVVPVVNFSVSDETIQYGDPLSPTISQTLTVNGTQVDPIAFGLGINPATAQSALAALVTIDAAGNPVVGFYGDGLVTANETIPYFGMIFTTSPGDLTVNNGPTTTDNPTSTFTGISNPGIGEMCAFRSDDEDPEEGGEDFDRIIELCGIIESATED